ncbi:MAG: ABC transporter ATP-binding protein [Thermoanaerobaculia bacterium]
MIRLENVNKVYRTERVETLALENINLDIAPGEFVSIMGPSGCGKSTLLNLIGLLDTPSSGALALAGEQVGKWGDKQLASFRNEKLGFVFQSFHLVPDLKVIDNVEIPLLYRRTNGTPRRKVAQTALDRVGLASRIHHFPTQLSGGQQQRVAVARALASRPEIIFGDEPTGNLDSRSGAEVLGFLRRSVRELGQTVVMVTHDPVAAAYADRVVFLADGRIVDEMADPTSERVLDRMKQFGD